MDLLFPASFRFGVADADLQVIGEKYCLERERSEETEWRRYALDTCNVFEHTTPDEGVDRYHLWQDDIELMKRLGIRHYRTSVSMARMLKRSGEVNAEAAEWYRRYYSALAKAGIKIYATLYHWELPYFLAEKGGWTNRRCVDWLVRHAEAVYENLGEFIEEFFLLNEPWCSSFLSYHMGINPPGRKNITEALLAAHHLLLAQGVAARTLLSKSLSLKVSTVLNVQPNYAATAEPRDIAAAARADAYFNTWFSDPIYLGKYPEVLIEHYGKAVPKFAGPDLEIMRIGKLLHGLGINYYRGDIVRDGKGNDLKYESVTAPGGPVNDLGWPIYLPPHYPEGMRDILLQFWWSYRNHGLKRLYITENGMALESRWDGKSGIVDDEPRVHFMRGHLEQLLKAIQAGVPVEGYFAWTLMDNFEWCHGHRPNSCFGLVHVDRPTLKRIPKQSALWYASIIKQQGASDTRSTS